MPSIFAVANAKGGSGKSTVAILLAGEFSNSLMFPLCIAMRIKRPFR